MKNKNYVYAMVALATITTLATAVPALADNTTPSTTPPQNHAAWGKGMRGNMQPGIFGKVTDISGDTITVDGKQGFGPNATSATFTVDATNAKVTKDTNTSATVSDIVVGDEIFATGTVTGTNVVATMIHDGKMPMRSGMGMGPKKGDGKGVLGMMGDGNPLVAGTVSSVNGSSFVITNPSNNTFTVDASNAKISKGSSTTASVSDIVVGDLVVVQGTFSGDNVTATMVIDHAAKPASNTSNTTDNSGNPTPHKGFFGGVGPFFSHLFGF